MVRQAEQHLSKAMQTATEIEAFVPLLFALPGAALLLADQEEQERAVELYALASRYPVVVNSHWFEDVVGQHIGGVTASLPPDVAAAAQTRGQARNLTTTGTELLIELGL